MRATTNKKDWICDDKGEFIGLSLGFDYCYEHESGIERLHAILGVPTMEFPIGTPDRKISVCPEDLEFTEHWDMPKDKRRKTGVPAASLILAPRRSYREMSHDELLKSFGLKFYCNVYDKWHNPESDDVMCAWGDGEFGINVRGEENVRRLRELHEAFRHLDIALAHPSSRGFLRTGLSFAIASRIPANAEETIKSQDLAHQRLELAAKATGVHEMLEKAGLRYYALGPGWENSEQEAGVIFFLNPQQQSQFNSGWFTVEDLQEWTMGKGPVIKDVRLVAFNEAHPDWQIHLIRGLDSEGLKLRRHSHLVWMDAEKTKVGVQLHPHHTSEDALPKGVYAFDELMAKYKPAEQTAEIS